jgi:hypothetical protein
MSKFKKGQSVVIRLISEDNMVGLFDSYISAMRDLAKQEFIIEEVIPKKHIDKDYFIYRLKGNIYSWEEQWLDYSKKYKIQRILK